jgi:membrane fusion protein (multidrug efflux system)
MTTQAETVPTLQKVAPPKAETKTPVRTRARLPWLRILLIGTVLTVVATLGTKWILRMQTFESTDDAYITGHNHPLSFRVSGTISEVLVDDNQRVRAGQPIARLDPRDYQVQVQQAKAGLERARAQLNQAEAQIIQAEAQLKQTQAQADAAKAKFDDSNRIYQRDSQLFYKGGGVISKQDLENAQYQSQGDEATYSSSQAAVRVAEANLQTARAQRVAAVAQVDSSQAALDNAQLQLSYTTLFAPTDGRIAKKSVETGQRVQPGQQLMAVAEPNVWIVANFKETQLGRIRPGQQVEIPIDAVRGVRFMGKVDSYQPGTGAVYALLPSDNATGNFTKIVQRVPVKIVFDPDSVKGYEDRIVPGLSVVPSVRVK